MSETLAMTLEQWVTERIDNCQRIAATKRGPDRMGWLEDAQYFLAILDALSDATAERQARERAEQERDAAIANSKAAQDDAYCCGRKEAESRAERLAEVIKELVVLKDIHDRIELCDFPPEDMGDAEQDYRERKPKAWAAARAALGEVGEGEKG